MVIFSHIYGSMLVSIANCPKKEKEEHKICQTELNFVKDFYGKMF